MGFNEFMAKVKYWDNLSAKWMIRHFYVLFFEVFLVVIFFVFFINVLKAIDINAEISSSNLTDQILFLQTVNTLVILLLLLLIAFWTLFIFSSLIRLSSTLRDVNFNISKLRSHGNFNAS